MGIVNNRDCEEIMSFCLFVFLSFLGRFVVLDARAAPKMIYFGIIVDNIDIHDRSFVQKNYFCI